MINRISFCFSKVFEVLYKNAYIGIEDAKVCRQVCPAWSRQIDNFFQKANFDSVKNLSGAKNLSDFKLTIPLQLEDIKRIWEMDVHTRCVSFGKKLTLRMKHDRFDNPLYPHPNQQQLTVLVETIRTFWYHFEHLEIIPAENTLDKSAPGSSGSEILVPFGDIGREIIGDVEMLERAALEEHSNKADDDFEKWQYLAFDPNRFQMYIPFLHHLKNLKSFTSRIKDRRATCNMLLRIPNTVQLERVVIRSEDQAPASWYKCASKLYTNCSRSITFLSGCELKALDILYADSKEACVFPSLEELHIDLIGNEHFEEMKMFSSVNGEITNMFPKVQVLKMNVNFELFHLTMRPWDWIYKFAKQLPALKHLSLGGYCMKNCVNLSENNDMPDATCESESECESEYNFSRGVSTFQFTCPTHLPRDFIRRFPEVKHVIVVEKPELQNPRWCVPVRETKSCDRMYIRRVFDLLGPHVSSLTFVPVSYCNKIGTISYGPGKVTRFRNDNWIKQGKRKRD